MNDLIHEYLNKESLNELISRAFDEDIGPGDVTTNAIIDENKQADAIWIAKEEGVIAGLEVGRAVFQSLDSQLQWTPIAKDGDWVSAGQEVVTMHGSCRAILTAERTALNLVQRMSGIATKTHHLAQKIAGFKTQLLDTRKTVPGLRKLDKYAVKIGGGTNHRMGLFDLAMIKDNHIVAAGGIEKAVKIVRSKNERIKIEVEAKNLKEVGQALAANADIIMLDNMSPDQMKQAVAVIGDKVETEASGNITAETIKKIAETGVDFISVGALTHSVNAFDISQQLQKIYK